MKKNNRESMKKFRRTILFRCEDLENLGTIFAGIRTTRYLAKKDGTGDIAVKILSWKNLKDIQNKKELSNLVEIRVNSQELYRRGYYQIDKDTIIFSALPGNNVDNIIYIESDFDENYFCGDNMYVFKNKSKISTRYIYMILNSGIYNDYLIRNKRMYNQRVGIEMLKKIEIPILENSEELTNEYFRIQQEKFKLQNVENEFNKQVHQQAIYAITVS